MNWQGPMAALYAVIALCWAGVGLVHDGGFHFFLGCLAFIGALVVVATAIWYVRLPVRKDEGNQS